MMRCNVVLKKMMEKSQICNTNQDYYLNVFFPLDKYQCVQQDSTNNQLEIPVCILISSFKQTFDISFRSKNRRFIGTKFPNNSIAHRRIDWKSAIIYSINFIYHEWSRNFNNQLIINDKPSLNLSNNQSSMLIWWFWMRRGTCSEGYTSSLPPNHWF